METVLYVPTHTPNTEEEPNAVPASAPIAPLVVEVMRERGYKSYHSGYTVLGWLIVPVAIIGIFGSWAQRTTALFSDTHNIGLLNDRLVNMTGWVGLLLFGGLMLVVGQISRVAQDMRRL